MKTVLHADNAVPWSDRPEAPAENPLAVEYDFLHISAYLWRRALTGLIRPFRYLSSFLIEMLEIVWLFLGRAKLASAQALSPLLSHVRPNWETQREAYSLVNLDDVHTHVLRTDRLND